MVAGVASEAAGSGRGRTGLQEGAGEVDAGGELLLHAVAAGDVERIGAAGAGEARIQALAAKIDVQVLLAIRARRAPESRPYSIEDKLEEAARLRSGKVYGLEGVQLGVGG